MKRREFIKGTVAAGAAIAVDPLAPARSKNERKEKKIRKAPAAGKPHIILIMSDQHRSDALCCMGNPSVRSPHIDALAREGTIFTAAYTASPSSTPARAGLLTGLSPWHHGMLGYGRVAAKYRYEMPRMLHELGYHTFGIGKMHWYPQNSLHGFEATLVDESGRSETPDFISDYRQWFQTQAPGENPDKSGLDWNGHSASVFPFDERLHPTAWTGDTACELIRNYDSGQPLFLKVSFARPHSPYDPPRRLLEMYRDVRIPGPVKGSWAEGFSALQTPDKNNETAAFANFGDAFAINSRRHYYANVSFIDEQVGRIVSMLKAKGMYDNSLIVYTADHGDMLGDHYHWRKTYPFEGSAHIPMIIKWPEGMKPGTVDDRPVELRDLLPTFLTVAGGTVPADMDGAPLCGETGQWREYIDLEHAQCYSRENYWCALTDGRIKYVWYFRTGREMLFDLTVDPSELNDLSADPAYRTRLEDLRSRMAEHLSERGDGFVKDGRPAVRSESLLYSPNYPWDGK